MAKRYYPTQGLFLMYEDERGPYPIASIPIAVKTRNMVEQADKLIIGALERSRITMQLWRDFGNDTI
jgi:hypothetical protein